MSVAWIRYEVRVLGTGARVAPLLAIAGIGFIAFLMETAGATAGDQANALTAALELGLPLVAGILTTSIVTTDRAIELQRSVRVPYRTTLLRRIGLLTTWSAVLALTTSVILDSNGYWVAAGSLVTSQLSWLAPLLWFVGAGILLAAVTRSWSASAALLGAVWIFQNVFEDWFLERDWTRQLFLFMTTHQPHAEDWTSTRITIAITGLVLGALGIIIRSRSESIDIGGHE